MGRRQRTKLTRPILEKLPMREWVKQRLTKLWSYERLWRGSQGRRRITTSRATTVSRTSPCCT